MRPRHPSITPSPVSTLIPLYRRPHHKSAARDEVQMKQAHWATPVTIPSWVGLSQARERRGEKKRKKENSQITAQTAGADFITFNLC